MHVLVVVARAPLKRATASNSDSNVSATGDRLPVNAAPDTLNSREVRDAAGRAQPHCASPFP